MLAVGSWCQVELENRARAVAVGRIRAQPLISKAAKVRESAERKYGRDALRVGLAVQQVFGQRPRGRSQPVLLRYGSRKRVIEDAAKHFDVTERMVRSVWKAYDNELLIIRARMFHQG
jgi:hypothetical protein